MARTYTSSFLRHLSFFDRSSTGTIKPYDTLLASLSLGLNFPLAALSSIALPLLYGNSGVLSSSISVQQVMSTRTMLEDVKLRQDSYGRGDLLAFVKEAGLNGWLDWIHVLGFWTLAADAKTGRVSARDVGLFQRGQLLPELEKRRMDRKNRLPFLRGGPFSVIGHAFLVSRMFGVKVYRPSKRE